MKLLNDNLLTWPFPIMFYRQNLLELDQSTQDSASAMLLCIQAHRQLPEQKEDSVEEAQKVKTVDRWSHGVQETLYID